MAKVKRGDKVCALLLCNKWGVDLTCLVGVLQKIERRGPDGALPVAIINVTKSFFLYGPVKEQKPHDFHLDAGLWKILPWTKETREEIKRVQSAARTLDKLTRKIRSS